jgi:hypothetical protein
LACARDRKNRIFEGRKGKNTKFPDRYIDPAVGCIELPYLHAPLCHNVPYTTESIFSRKLRQQRKIKASEILKRLGHQIRKA